MILRDTLLHLFWFGLLAVVLAFAIGCGNVSPRAAAGGESGRGADGTAGAAGAAGAELGQGGELEPDAAAAADAAPDAAAPVCLEASAAGFAINGTCTGGPPASAGCHAACTLDGAPFVGCVTGSPYASRCYASCAACGAL